MYILWHYRTAFADYQLGFRFFFFFKQVFRIFKYADLSCGNKNNDGNNDNYGGNNINNNNSVIVAKRARGEKSFWISPTRKKSQELLEENVQIFWKKFSLLNFDQNEAEKQATTCYKLM